jgi:hypothetical protein
MHSSSQLVLRDERGGEMIQEFGDNLIPVAAIGCTFLFLTIWVVLATIANIVSTLINGRLKVRMIDRGYSASEIERVLNAGVSADEDGSMGEVTNRPAPPIKTVKQCC